MAKKIQQIEPKILRERTLSVTLTEFDNNREQQRFDFGGFSKIEILGILEILKMHQEQVIINDWLKNETHNQREVAQ